MAVTDAPPGDSWGVLHVKPLQERAVLARLEQRGLRGSLPLYRKRPVRRDRLPLLVPLFPGYVFVELSAEAGAYRAMWTPGVLRLLGDDRRPHLVPGELMAELADRAKEKGYIVLGRRFSPRETVRIVRGIFAGLEGIFQQETSDGERVQILLSHLGYRAVVDLSAEDVEASASRARRR